MTGRSTTTVAGRPASSAGPTVSNLTSQSPASYRPASLLPFLYPILSPLTLSAVHVPALTSSWYISGLICCSALSALDWIWIGPPYGAYDDACSKSATFIPFEWQAAATTSPASPPPATRTVRGSSAVTGRPPAGTDRCVLHHACSSSSPTSIPLSSRASSAACLARLRIRSVRSSLSASRFGASGSARTDATWSGMSTLFDAGACPSASHGTCGSDSFRLRRTCAGPIDEACSPITRSRVEDDAAAGDADTSDRESGATKALDSPARASTAPRAAADLRLSSTIFRQANQPSWVSGGME
mmetsp:Transcript_18529/g.43316  ORF Transcript_18529/g.43316 Transcript_18529/m.43316 type:complete len:300 (-) Transcript_18529:62-961(-)